MSLSRVEKAIWAEAKRVLNNPKMKLKELLEWSTGSVDAAEGETSVRLPEHGVNIIVPSSCDKR